ncbi:hypothetical protein V5O48_003435 [Marasmius crinis-equi]|uniref:F-box domain-containing protein n=1 Tax=Marasmius crinis-equi TaxID=585013 RepID=A0ABR3FTZ7_9AGAR
MSTTANDIISTILQHDPTIAAIVDFVDTTVIQEYPTPPDQQKAIEKHLQDGRKQLGDYANTLTRLHDAIKAIEDRRAKLFAAVERLTRMTLVIHQLPPEILTKIFILRWEAESATPGDGSAVRASLTLSHVCSKWRQITMQLPKLWSCQGISLADFKNELTLLEKKLRLVQLLHERSGQTPLRISFRFPEERNIAPAAELVLGELRRSSNRWEEAFFTLQDTLHLELPRDLQSLHTLAIDALHNSPGALFANMFAGGLTVPSGIAFPHLRSLNLKMGDRDIRSILRLMHVHTLERLSVHGATEIVTMFQVLDYFRNLTFLKYELPTSMIPLDGNPRSYSLESLTLSFMHTPESLGIVLQGLNLPRLRSLSVARFRIFRYLGAAGYGRDTPQDDSLDRAVVNFLNRSNPSLTSLTLHPIPFQDFDTLDQVLSMLPLLTNLVLHGSPSMLQSTIERMTVEDTFGSAIIGPQVESLELGFTSRRDEYESDMRVAGLVQSRWRFGGEEGKVKKLKKFTLVCYGKQLLPSERESLLALQSEGLELSIQVEQEPRFR